MNHKYYEDVMHRLKQVPGVKKHLSKHAVLMGKKILKRRIELGYTQLKVVEESKKKGYALTQATLSRAESGDDNITSATYDKIVEALGGLEDITPEFKVLSKSETP